MARALWSHGREKRLTSTFWRIPYGRAALLGSATPERWRELPRACHVGNAESAHVGPAQQLAIAYAIDLWRALRSGGGPVQ